jgi:hypothetical protein
MLNIRLLHLVKQVLHRSPFSCRLALLLARFWFSSSSPAGSKSTTSASGTLRLAVTSSFTSTSFAAAQRSERFLLALGIEYLPFNSQHVASRLRRAFG